MLEKAAERARAAATKKKWRFTGAAAAKKPLTQEELAMKEMSNLKDGLFEGDQYIKQKFVNPDGLPKAAHDATQPIFTGVHTAIEQIKESPQVVIARPSNVEIFKSALKMAYMPKVKELKKNIRTMRQHFL